LIDCIRTTNPKLSVTHNGSGFHNAFDWEFCDSDDYVCREFHFNEGPGNLSLTCRKNWALKPGKPYEIELWRFANRLGGSNRTFRAYQVRPADTLLMEMGATVAHGGFPQYYDQIRPDGELDVRSMERVTAAFAKGKVRQRWRGVGEPVPYAAILWSKATDAFAPGASKKMHIDGLTGVHHAFMESHLPVHLVTEREVEQGDFRGAKVVVLPSTECLSEECVKGLKAFVNNGGGLVVMGRSSMRDGKGNALKNFALADVLGVNYDGMTKKWYGYLNFESRHASNRKLPINFPISVNETLQVKVKAGRGTKVLGTIVEPMYGFHMGFPPDKRTGVPGMTVRETGKGRVVYFGSDQGAVYRGFNHADNRQLIVSAVTWAAGEQSPITAKAPETVEVVPWRDEENKRTVVHLVNKTGAGLAQGDGGMMHETIPVHDLTLRVAGPLAGKRAALQPAQRELPVSWEGTTMVISIDKLDVWEVVEIS